MNQSKDRSDLYSLILFSPCLSKWRFSYNNPTLTSFTLPHVFLPLLFFHPTIRIFPSATTLYTESTRGAGLITFPPQFARGSQAQWRCSSKPDTKNNGPSCVCWLYFRRTVKREEEEGEDDDDYYDYGCCCCNGVGGIVRGEALFFLFFLLLLDGSSVFTFAFWENSYGWGDQKDIGIEVGR